MGVGPANVAQAVALVSRDLSATLGLSSETAEALTRRRYRSMGTSHHRPTIKPGSNRLGIMALPAQPDRSGEPDASGLFPGGVRNSHNDRATQTPINPSHIKSRKPGWRRRKGDSGKAVNGV
ncbi:MAG: hypothetical protein LC808_14310 [Actinobacteria bacterium]|nr:hypothetical protein [Actinomycetota bacterium]